METDAPSLTLNGLTLSVIGRQYPDSRDEWDGNWLMIHVHCLFGSTSISFSDPCLDTVSFHTFKQEIEKLDKEHAETATLSSVEPYFSLTISKADELGHYLARIDVTPDNLHESHWFEFDIDQSYFSTLVRRCDAILQSYPVILADKRGLS